MCATEIHCWAFLIVPTQDRTEDLQRVKPTWWPLHYRNAVEAARAGTSQLVILAKQPSIRRWRVRFHWEQGNRTKLSVKWSMFVKHRWHCTNNRTGLAHRRNVNHPFEGSPFKRRYGAFRVAKRPIFQLLTRMNECKLKCQRTFPIGSGRYSKAWPCQYKELWCHPLCTESCGQTTYPRRDSNPQSLT